MAKLPWVIVIIILIIVTITGCSDNLSREARYIRIQMKEERPLKRDCLKEKTWKHVILIPAGMGVLFPITKTEKMCVKYSEWY